MIRVQELEQKIVAASLRYYKGEDNKVTDQEFDNWIEELRSLNSDSHILKLTGWGFTDKESDVKHIGKHPAGSLDKYKYPEMPPFPVKLVTGKLDGLTVIVTASNGVITAATRGDGIEGKNITPAMLVVLEKYGFPTDLSYYLCHKKFMSIRGEAIILRKNESELGRLIIAERMANLKEGEELDTNLSFRNICAGILNSKEISKYIRFVDFVPYFIRVDVDQWLSSQSDVLSYLSAIGFPRCPQMCIEGELDDLDKTEYTVEDLTKFFEKYKDEYPLDGVVISQNQGFNNPEDFTEYETQSVAYKFESESATVTVTNVTWETGASGRINPRIEYTPVWLAGAMCSAATAFNNDFIQKNHLGVGAKVKITRSGEVIPYIMCVLEPSGVIITLRECPCCGEPASTKGVFLMCNNYTCPAKSSAVLEQFFITCGMVEGCAASTINKWLAEYPVMGSSERIESLHDFLTHFAAAGKKDNGGRAQVLVEKFGEHAGRLLHKLEKNIEAKLFSGISYREFWQLLRLPGLAESQSIKFNSINPFSMNEQQLIDAKVPVNVIESLNNDVDKTDNKYNWYKTALFMRQHTMFYEAKEVKSAAIMRVVVTGAVRVKRPEWVKIMTSHGIEVASGVTAKVKFLICNEGSSSSKAKDAAKLGVSTLTEDEFYRFLSVNHSINIDI